MSIPYLYKIPHEKPGFQLPPQPYLIQYISSLSMENGENLFIKAVNNMPNKDIQLVVEKMTDDNRIPAEEKVNKAASMLTFNLLANRICEECGDKSDITKLSICGSCALAWYCSKECQEKHWSKHQLRCCNKDGPLNDGYQAIAFAKRKDE